MKAAVLPDGPSAARPVLVVGLAVGAVFLALPVPPVAVALGMSVYAGGAALVLRTRAQGAFGAANTVTLIRLGGAAVFAGFLAAPALLAGPAGWIAAAAATVLLALDGIDGWLARRGGTASEFGARFDMETDAFMILVLSGLALALGKAGLWVLLLGALRYGFVAASVWQPKLAAPLPPSFRRKAVCVLQLAVLTLLLLPVVRDPLSSLMAFVALLALVWSFAVDVRWLLRAGA